MIKNLFRKGREDSEDSSTPATGETKGRILVVDDSPTEIVVFKKILEKQEYQILVAKDGQQGVDRCQPGKAKRRLVVPGSREAILETRRAVGA
ncbi:MAG: hypothetical protein ABW068_02930, partial [Candidatus Thiodiazotropha sp.]